MYETRRHPQWNLASTVYRKPNLTPITCYSEKNSMLPFMKLHLERKLPICFRKAVCHHHFSIHNIGSLYHIAKDNTFHPKTSAALILLSSETHASSHRFIHQQMQTTYLQVLQIDTVIFPIVGSPPSKTLKVVSI